MEGSISNIMVKIVATVDMEDTVDWVEKTASLHKLSTIPVLRQDGSCFGMIRAGDLDSFRASGRKAKAVKAWEICIPRVIEVEADTSIETAANLIQSSKAHHLLVKEKNTILGIVHAIDIAESSLSNNYFSPTAVDEIP